MSLIRRNSQLCSGAPTLEGRRLTVYNVVSRVVMEGREVVAEDMELSADQIAACLQYCADLECVREGAPLRLPFCFHCRLDLCPPEQLEAHAEEFRQTGDPAVLGLRMPEEDHDASFTWLLAAEQLAPQREL